MEKSNLRLSIKFKIMGILIALCVFILLVYALLAINDFEKDKIAYVYDSAGAQARSTSRQIDSEFTGNVIPKIKFFMRGYNFQSGKSGWEK